MKRVLVVGQAPSRRDEPLGISGKRLASLAGLSALRDVFDVTTLLAVSSQGERWPADLARRTAEAFDFGAHDTVIVVGYNVARAFDIIEHPCVWQIDDNRAFLVIPHVQNRWWDQAMNVAAVKRVMIFAAKLANWERPPRWWEVVEKNRVVDVAPRRYRRALR